MPDHPYGEDFETPFHARRWSEREAVVGALIPVLLGPDTDGCRAASQQNPADPFVEILRSVARNHDRLWQRVRRWPHPIQDRIRGAWDLLHAKRAARVPKNGRPANTKPPGYRSEEQT